LLHPFSLLLTHLIPRMSRGPLSESTRARYQQTFRHMTAFLKDKNTLVDDIGISAIEGFKVFRTHAIDQMKQSRGGSSIALDIAVLHRIFAFAVKKKMMSQNPIDLSSESGPGENPKNGARSFSADELSRLRHYAQFVDEAGKKPIRVKNDKGHVTKDDDFFMLLVLRWTGLRGSDAINLRWENVHFDQGINGEIRALTQKRSNIATIPLVTELRNALERVIAERYKGRVPSGDFVLYNPETGHPYSNRARLYERVRKLGIRPGVERVHPHCFRDTLACDMLAKEISIFDVAKVLADTHKTIEDHYAAFVPAARDAAQIRMDTGMGIEERGRLANSRGKKVVGFPGR
jgi:integrase